MFLSVDSVLRASAPGCEEVSEICLKCGVCCIIESHHCPIQHDAKYDPKFTYVYDMLSSEETLSNPNLWQCVSCHKCEELCPYDVSPVHFIELMKALAFTRGEAHESIVNEIESVIGTGYAFPVTDFSERQRTQMGLPPLNLEYGDLGRIAEKTRLTETIEKYRVKKP